VEITAVKKDYLPEMAALFVQNFRKLRTKVPMLPDLLEDSERIVGMLENMRNGCPGVAALDNGRVTGYMMWYLVDHFRNTARKGAYCPEWGHATIEELRPEVYRAMYRTAANQWADAGCHVHALSLLAHDRQAQDVWFWNGFGLTVVDAVRALSPLGLSSPTGVTVRQASPEDVGALSILEVEHWQHYTQPPVQMDAYEPQDAAALTRFLSGSNNSIWVALDGKEYAGYMRFEAEGEGAVAIVSAPDNVANTGAFIRPQYRGRKVAIALLNAGMQYYADKGFKRCSVDFESFNPDAAAFWPRYFEPVCFSVVRVPERQSPPEHN
jgi:GNAT superfamily N-acetyltransferase